MPAKFRPTVALYVDFGVTVAFDPDTGAVSRVGFEIIGGGLMFGVVSKAHVALYGMAGPVPVYIGSDMQLSLYVLVGATHGVLRDIPNDIFGDESNIWNFNTVLQGLLYATGYVGAGLAGTLGVRGGVEVNISAQWNPTIRNRYPDLYDSLR